MIEDTVIRVENVEKGFKVYTDKGYTLKEKLLFFRQRNSYTRYEVLKGISLEIKKGEVVGLIGHNGCGKSTLLKLMTKIIYPDKGEIRIKGKVSSLLELGAGFHPDMTGRENIYTNASIFGLTKKEIDVRLDEIIKFSELEEFIDSPVRTYSSGMYMRLAFSVAINVDADILLIDEILAVGDARFQAKCFNKMLELKKKGITIVIVSHDLGSIERLCNRAIWIEKGLIKDEGDPRGITMKYLTNIMNKNEKIQSKDIEESNIKNSENRTGNFDVLIKNIEILDPKTRKTKKVFNTEDSMIIKIDYERKKFEITQIVVGFAIYRVDGIHCYGTNTFVDNLEQAQLKNSGSIEINIEELQLIPSEYFIDVAFHDEYGVPYDDITKAKKINIFSNIKDQGIFRIKHKFKSI